MRHMAPLTAAELIAHPEFKNVTWDLPPTKKGKAAVAEGRGGPIQIAYEVHGRGPKCLVVYFISQLWLLYGLLIYLISHIVSQSIC